MAASRAFHAAAIILAVLLPQQAGAQAYLRFAPNSAPLRPTLALCGEADIVSLSALQQFATRSTLDRQFDVVDGNAPMRDKSGVTLIYAGSLAKSDAPAPCAADLVSEIATVSTALRGSPGNMPMARGLEYGPTISVTHFFPDEDGTVRLVVSLCNTQHYDIADCRDWLRRSLFGD